MRRRKAVKRQISPDAKYSSKLAATFINKLMREGKKSKAEKILYEAMEILKQRTQSEDAMAILQKSIDNVKPALEVKSRRIGGATYQVPIEVSSERGIALAVRWIRDFARARKGKPMKEKLAEEILEAYKGSGNAIKKKMDTHKMAEANRAFAHYKW